MTWIALLLCGTAPLVELSLKPSALTTASHARLSDVLSLDSFQRLAADGAPDLQLATLRGETRIGRGAVAAAIAKALPETEIKWSGPTATVVRRKGGSFSAGALEQAVADWMEAHAPADGAFYVDQIIAPRLSNTPPGAMTYRVRRRGERPLIGRGSLYVDLYLDNKKYKTLAVQVVTSVETLVAKPLKDIDRGEPIREQDIEWAFERIDRVVAPLVTADDFEGLRARTPLRAGVVLTRRHVEAIPLVERNRPVTVIAGRGNLKIRLKARALDTGAAGDRVRVKNLGSGAVLYGRVQKNGEIKLETL